MINALPLGLSLTDAPDSAMMERVYRLRVDAWRARTEQFPDIAEWRDDWDDHANHWVIHCNGVPVAAARMTKHDSWSDLPNAEIFAHLDATRFPPPIASINRLVVARSHAGMGLSRFLDEIRIQRAREWDCKFIIGQTFAGENRHNQLRSLGFVDLGLAGAYASGPLSLVKSCSVSDRHPPQLANYRSNVAFICPL